MLQTQSSSRWARGLALGAIIAVAITVAASGRLFAMAGGGSAGPIKDVFCRAIGCPNGSRACAQATVGVEVDKFGKVEVTYQCYEPGVGGGGGGGDVT